MKALVSKIGDRLVSGQLDENLRRCFIVAGTCFVMCHVDSLRGPEGSSLDLDGLQKNHWKGPEEDCFILSLLGKVEGEHGERGGAFAAHCVENSAGN